MQVILSRPARRPVAEGEVTARTRGFGCLQSAPVWWEPPFVGVGWTDPHLNG
jgi:hypothetical protein